MNEIVQQLVFHPRERLDVELKPWLDLENPHDIGLFVKAILALRNHGGGFLVIGFDNETCTPILDGLPEDTGVAFHADKISALIARYASDPFEVYAHFASRDGHDFPVIQVPSGVKTPVAVKSDLIANNKSVLKCDKVYVRSLGANGKPSSTELRWKDWGALAETCFDNREADIGQFIRRHLSGLSSEGLREIVSLLSLQPASLQVRHSRPSLINRVRGYLSEGEGHYRNAVAKRNLRVPEYGVWEVSSVIDGDAKDKHSPTRSFLRLLDSHNPELTGWRPWLDSTGFSNRDDWPYVDHGCWQALIERLGRGSSDQLDFWRIDPKGQFFLYRALDDDIGSDGGAPEPFQVLDAGLAILRTAEAIIACLSFAKAMGYPSDITQLGFCFKWERLGGRILGRWATPRPNISGTYRTQQDTLLSDVIVPLETPLSSIAPFVDQVTARLFELFEGFQMDLSITEDLCRKLLERRL